MPVTPLGRRPYPTPSASLALAETAGALVNGAGWTSLAFGAFSDQQWGTLGTGDPTDPAVVAYLATLGLSVDAAGEVFTVLPGSGGLFAVMVEIISVNAATAHSAMVEINGIGSGAGFAGIYHPTLTLPAGTPAQTRFTLTDSDSLIAGDNFRVQHYGTNGETDLSVIELGIVRMR